MKLLQIVAVPGTLLDARRTELAPLLGRYIVSIDVNSNMGIGHIDTTLDPHAARQFADNHAAIEYWSRRSKVAPIRFDGHPNRPGTAVTVETVEYQP